MDPASLFVGALFTSAATYAYNRWTTSTVISNPDPVLPSNSNQTPSSNNVPKGDDAKESPQVPSSKFLTDVLAARASLRPPVNSSVNSSETPVLSKTKSRMDPTVLLLNINRARLSLKPPPSDTKEPEDELKPENEADGYETVYRLIVARRDQFEPDLESSGFGSFITPSSSVIIPPPSSVIISSPSDNQVKTLDMKLEEHLEAERELKQKFFDADMDEMMNWLESKYIHRPSPLDTSEQKEDEEQEEVSTQLSQIYSPEEYYFIAVPVNPLSLSSLREEESDCEDLDVSDEMLPPFKSSDEVIPINPSDDDLESLLRALGQPEIPVKSYPITQQMKDELDQLLEEIIAMKPKEASMIFDPIPIANTNESRDTLANLELNPESKQEGSLWELMRDIN